MCERHNNNWLLQLNAIDLEIQISDAAPAQVQVELRAKRPTCFALGVRKSGSSIFSSIVNALAMHGGQANAIDIPGEMFAKGYRYTDWNQPPLCDLVWRGNVYIGFRDPPSALYQDPVFIESKKILVVRDPRDALVSEYFSNAYSHSMPTTGSEQSVLAKERAVALQESISRYVVSRTSHLNATVEKYGPLLNDPNLKIMRYEDVILKKANWIREISNHFEFEIDEGLVNDILGWADVVPESENKKAFVRRVVPGDHLEKLDPDVISKINNSLSDIWKRFGYE